MRSTLQRSKQAASGVTTLLLSLIFISLSTTPAYAETTKDFRTALSEVITSSSTAPYDISEYNVTSAELWRVWSDLTSNELAFEYNINYTPYYLETMNGTKVESVRLGFSNSNYESDYSAALESINDILDGIDSEMSDLDKLVYINNEIKERTVYTRHTQLDHPDAKNIVYNSIGVFVYGKAVCEGYSDALDYLLDEVGIDTEHVASPNMNHKWNLIKIDGEWYHNDVTWNDSANQNIYLLRNDSEFESELPRNHYDWFVTTGYVAGSNSTEFTDWFVHDVTSDMFYEDGVWYYVDPETNAIVSSDIYGNDHISWIENTSGDLELIKVQNETITYEQNGAVISITLEELNTPIAEPIIEEIPIVEEPVIEKPTSEDAPSTETNTDDDSTPSEDTTVSDTTSSEDDTVDDTAPSEDTTIGDTTPSEDNTVEDATPSEDNTVEDATPSEDNIVEDAAPSEDNIVEDSAPSEDNTVEDAAPSEDSTVEDSAPSEDNIVEDAAPSEDNTVEDAAPSEDSTVEDSAPSEDSTVEDSTLSEEDNTVEDAAPSINDTTETTSVSAPTPPTIMGPTSLSFF